MLSLSPFPSEPQASRGGHPLGGTTSSVGTSSMKQLSGWGEEMRARAGVGLRTAL